jgi:hypothetical protein
MKLNRLISIFLALVTVLCLSACDSSSGKSDDGSDAKNDAKNEKTTTAAPTTTTEVTTKRIFVARDTSDETFYSIETYGDYVAVLKRLKQEYVAEANEINQSLSGVIADYDAASDGFSQRIDGEIEGITRDYDLEKNLGNDYEICVDYLFQLRSLAIDYLESMQASRDAVDQGAQMLWDAFW